MSIFDRLKPPPPPPIYKRQPIATIAVILTIVGMFVLGPVGYLWNGMAEELKVVKSEVKNLEKEKVDNENLKDTLTELKQQRKETNDALKDQNNSIQTNQLAIKEILTRQEMLTAPKGFQIKGEVRTQPVKKIEVEENNINLVEKQKVSLTPEQFERYLSMKPEIRAKYKKYLESTGKDVSGLPD